MMKRFLIVAVNIFSAVCFGQLSGIMEPSPDFIAIKQKIKDSVTGWLQKREFEKSGAYAARTENELARSFDSICFDVVQTAITFQIREQ